MTDEFDRDVLLAFRRLVERVQRPEEPTSSLTPLGERVQLHMGTDVTALPVVAESIEAHRLVDADLALEALAEDGSGPGDGEAVLIGVRGENRDHIGLAAMLSAGWARSTSGTVDWALAPAGPTSRRRIVAFGVRLFRFEGEPVAVLQRGANAQVGRERAGVEVLAGSTEAGERLIDAIRRTMHERSVLRGQVLTFGRSGEYGEMGASMFLPREAIPAEDVVLGPGVLDTVRGHVLGIAEHRDALLAAGRHLKRGVLLYGPPGTGKTLTVRHLVGATEGTTVILLTGPSIGYIAEATDLARGLQPAMVVLEDIDLVAEERGRHGPQPLLFAVLDALDGLEGDADVTFLMTTNRVDVLERALAQRPGRVDLAVEVPRPDAEARTRLFGLYARGLPLSSEAVEAAAQRAEGVTASFAKELMRRVVLEAAIAGHDVGDDDLGEALDAMLDAGAALTRRLLGMGRDVEDAAGEDDEEGSGAGWTASSPLSRRSFDPSP